MDALLSALQCKKWTRRRRKNVFDVPCYTELAHPYNKDAPLLHLALDTAPHRDFTFAQLSRSVEMKKHVDRYNFDGSLLLLLGDFTGGALCFEDGRRFAEKGVWIPFHGQQPHWVEPFDGDRFSIILFNNPALEKRLRRMHPSVWPVLNGDSIDKSNASKAIEREDSPGSGNGGV